MKIDNKLPAFFSGQQGYKIKYSGTIDTTLNYVCRIEEAWGNSVNIRRINCTIEEKNNLLLCNIPNGFTTNGYYKIIIEKEEENTYVPLTNYGIAKCIAQPFVTVSLDENFKATITYSPATNSDEFLYSIQYFLYKGPVDNNRLLEQSNEIVCYYSGLNPIETNIWEYQFGKYFEIGTNVQYLLKVIYTTINKCTEEKIYTKEFTTSLNENYTLVQEYDKENALITIYAPPEGGKLYRTNNEQTYYYLRDISIGDIVFDLAISHGENNNEYILETSSGIVQQNNDLENIFLDFDDMFLYDNKKQLCIRYNPKVSSIKNNVQETKIETIGGQYPVFFRNGNILYKEFSISGLISTDIDNNGYFINTQNQTDRNILRLRSQTPAPNNNEIIINKSLGNIFAEERKFKFEVLDWLTNGKPKVFKSPIEGNHIVRITNVNLTPEEKLGRMLHQFSCTAIEIDEYNLKNLEKYDLLSFQK